MTGLSSAPPPTTSPGSKPAARALVGAAILLGALWGFGFTRFLLADGVVHQTLPRREAPPSGEHNLAAYRFGPRVRASSYHRDSASNHHPSFVVDERARPTLTEKWVSAFNDPEPWLEVHFREAHAVGRVRMRLAGLVEDGALNMRSYRLLCLGGEASAEVVVTDNRASEVEHALSCRDATGVRAEFTLGKRDDRARVFELEVWGR
jgi:hypothetical protein